MEDKIERIIRWISFKGLFRELYPERYRERGASHCPFHDDKNPSFYVGERYGYCHAGCAPSGKSRRYSVIDLYREKFNTSTSGAIEALGRTCGLYSEPGLGRMRQLVKVYQYKDQGGQLIYEKLRYEPKSFMWRRVDSSGQYQYNLNGVTRILYNLPEISVSEPGALVLFVEGEKDVDSLKRLGYLATTSGSARGWKSLVQNHSIQLPLSGKRVWVIPDKDNPGRTMAINVANTLHGFCPEVKVFELPGDDVKDASDLIEKFGDEAARMIDEAGSRAHFYEPSQSAHEQSSVLTPDKPGRTRRTKFQLLDEMFQIIDWDFFIDQFGELWASITIGDHHENVYVNSGRFNDMVRAQFKAIFSDGVSKDVIRQVIGAIKGDINGHIPARNIEYRITHDKNDGSILVDSGRDDWSIIRITSGGYELQQTKNSPFKREPNSRAYDVTESGACGSWDDLFQVISVDDPQSQGLIKMWMALTMIPGIPKPGLIINGPPGSGKSFCAQIIRQIVDPCSNPLIGFPRDIENLKLTLFKNHIPTFDNLNRLDADESDCLCQAVTGICFEKRKLHTDSDTIRWHLKRQWMLTGVSLPGAMADFLSRSFIVEMRPIPAQKRKDELELNEIFDRIRPGIQARLFECARHFLRNQNDIRTSGFQRLADAHRSCLAMAEPLEMSAAQIDTLWNINQDKQTSQTLEHDVVAQTIIQFIKEQKNWVGQPTELFDSLSKYADVNNQPWKKSWPASAGVLSKRINYIAESLNSNGVFISDLKTNQKRLRKLIYDPTRIGIDLLNEN